MRILVAYASKTGTAKKCAEQLTAKLENQQVNCVDLERESPDPANYDVVVLGSSVRFGKIRPALRRYLQKHGETLQKKPHGLFLCCGFGHDFEGYAKRQFHEGLRETAFAILNFGGFLKLEKPSLWERYYLYRVRVAIRESDFDDYEFTPALPGLLPENINRMASAVREALWELKQQSL